MVALEVAPRDDVRNLPQSNVHVTISNVYVPIFEVDVPMCNVQCDVRADSAKYRYHSGKSQGVSH